MKGVSLCVVVLSFVGALTAYKTYSGYKVYNVFPVTEGDVGSLAELEVLFDFWSHPRLNQPAQVLVSPQEEEAFLTHVQVLGLKTEVSVEDLGPLIAEQADFIQNRVAIPPGSRQFYETYHTLEEIHEWMFEMADTYSDLVTVFEVAKSYEGRSLYTFLISTDQGSSKPAVWFDGGIHAREWVSPATVMYLAEQLLSNYGSDDTVTMLLDEMDWFVLPVFNVDGYEYTWTDDRLWRKTRSPNEGSNCVGTDPNRNWDVEWGTVGISHDPCSNSYCGSAPFSEIEVDTVASYIESTPRIVAYLAYHSYGQMFMTPYGYQFETPPDFDKLIESCERALVALEAVHGQDYTCDALINLVGPSSGSSADYTYSELDVTWSYGVELRDKGQYGFELPEELILPTAEENYAFLLDLAQSILDDITPR